MSEFKTSIPPADLTQINNALSAANREFIAFYPGESNRRQPVHVLYGGGHLFKADSARKLGENALRSLADNAPDAASLAAALGLEGDAAFAERLYARVVEKLRREPVEDFRLDYEDGYGNRLDAEEDGHAAQGGREVARGLIDGTLPPFIGIRIKPMNEDLRVRATRTLDIFVTTMLAESGGRLPENFVITIPKVQIAEQVTAVVKLLEVLERKNGLAAGALKIEPMIETPQAIIDRHGKLPLPSLIAAAHGRCTGVHFGVYDYTASRNITAAYQGMSHAVCDFAREVMAISLAGTGIFLSDGATNILPVGSPDTVRHAWKLAFLDTSHSLKMGIYEGWDLHPAQFIPRYAAVYAFFLGGLEAASKRLKAFMEKAALASLCGDVFDDAATGQGLLNFFLRGISCGAITEAEALATGLTLEEIRLRSFLKILQARRG